MNFLLEITKDQYGLTNLISELGFKETIFFGLKILLLGMGAVFAVLCLIWICLAIFSRVFSTGNKKSAKKVLDATPAQMTTPASTSTQNDEIVAVIAAAIAMAESEGNGAKFRVVSFNRK